MNPKAKHRLDTAVRCTAGRGACHGPLQALPGPGAAALRSGWVACRSLGWAGLWRALFDAFSRALRAVLSVASGPPDAGPPGQRASVHGAPSSSGGGDADEGCRQSMMSVIEDQIIPRLIFARSTTEDRLRQLSQPPQARSRPGPDEIAWFARRCASEDHAGARVVIDRMVAAGVSEESVFMDLIAPAARHLGALWEVDAIDFTAVTTGLVLMNEIIHGMGYEYQRGPQAAGPSRRIMLASAPGSQHILGLAIVSQFFRKAGWQVALEVSVSAAELRRAVRNEWFDVIGLSVAIGLQLPDLPRLIDELKAASRNPDVVVLLGGPVFSLLPVSASQLHAEAICTDAQQAVAMALELIDRQSAR